MKNESPMNNRLTGWKIVNIIIYEWDPPEEISGGGS